MNAKRIAINCIAAIRRYKFEFFVLLCIGLLVASLEVPH